MFTRKDFIDVADLIKKIRRNKRKAAFEQWSDKFCDNSPSFDEEKFANACGFYFDQYQSEYRFKK